MPRSTAGDIILGGSGIYHLHRVWGDQITVANFLTAMLLVSDNTAVRMCGRLVPALEINEILAAKGKVLQQVDWRKAGVIDAVIPARSGGSGGARRALGRRVERRVLERRRQPRHVGLRPHLTCLPVLARP